MKCVAAEVSHSVVGGTGRQRTREDFVLPLMKIVDTVDIEPLTLIPEFLNNKPTSN